MNREVTPTVAIIVCAVILVVVLAIGWRMFAGPGRSATGRPVSSSAQLSGMTASAGLPASAGMRSGMGSGFGSAGYMRSGMGSAGR